jgi:hypothetical protein
MIYSVVMKKHGEVPMMTQKKSQLDYELFGSQPSPTLSIYPTVRSAPLKYDKTVCGNINSYPEALAFGVGDDLYSKIRWCLLFGRIIGVLPCQGVFQRDHRKFRFS